MIKRSYFSFTRRFSTFAQPQFKPLKDDFNNMLLTTDAVGEQLCVFQNGEKVASLAGGKFRTGRNADIDESQTYDENTLHRLFSTGKNTEVVVVGMLVDRGLLNYEAKIADYWPEFGCKGKEKITIKDLMQHSGGVESLSRQLLSSDINLKEFPQFLAETPRSEKRKAYHAVTRGFFVSEICKRVDGRTITQFVKDELYPLGINITIGADENFDYSRLTSLGGMSKLDQVQKVFMPSMFPNQFSSDHFPEHFGLTERDKAACKGLLAAIMDSKNLAFEAFTNFSILDFPKAQNSEHWAQMASSSGSSIGTATDLAKLGYLMTNKGNINGKQIISEKTWELMHTGGAYTMDEQMQVEFAYTTGGFGGPSQKTKEGKIHYFMEEVLKSELDVDHPVFGWMGVGGQLCVWIPTLNLSLGYVTNQASISLFGQRSVRALRKTIQCAKQNLLAKEI